MKERPIIFTAPEVRAILDGRKTMTRRVVKLPEIISEPGDADATSVGWLDHHESGPGWHGWMTEYPEEGSVPLRCPYGQPGERLWVRENLRPTRDEMGYVVDWHYAADGAKVPRCPDLLPQFNDGMAFAYLARPYVSSKHMPRWASRITLEIESVRLERLQDISEADALAEGCPCYVCGAPLDGNSEADCHCFHRTATASDYRDLWEHINGEGSWSANPWVWAITFKRLAP